MSAFSGKQYPGAMRDHWESKRRQAEERNARTPVEKTRAYREGSAESRKS